LFDLKQQFDLTGKVAVIAGAANILGPEFVDALAQFGANIAVMDVNEERVKEVAEQVKNARGVETAAYTVDVTDQVEVEHAVENVLENFGKIDILVSAAATKTENYFAKFPGYPLDDWNRVIEVNLGGSFIMAQAVVPHFIEAGKGSIINISSIYGVVGPDQRVYEGSDYLGGQINTPPPYSASKAGVVGLTRYFATTLAQHGIRVNSITPGGVESGQNDEFIRRYSDRIPMGRMADRTELQGALVFLASDASSYITGQNIVVDGGLTAW